MSDPVRNIYKGRFVAKEKLVEAEARIAELEKVADAAKAIAEDFPEFTVLARALRSAGYLK